MRMQVGLIVVLAITLSACDTMIADRIVIRAATRNPERALAVPHLIETAHAALAQCGLSDTQISSDENTLHWRDPDHLPGLQIIVEDAAGQVRVTLAQDLYGPIGPTDAYRCVQKTLRRQLEERFGKESLRFES